MKGIPATRRMGWLILLFFCCISILTPVTMGADKYFPLDKVRPGLNGIAYTVFSGTKIEAFHVRIIDVLDNGAVHGKLILVQLSGKNVVENGGLAAGMSGSPVYIGNQLLGAISFGFENADPTLAMVTPIESMLKLLDNRPTTQNMRPVFPGIPASAPVMVTGMGQRGFELIRTTLRQAGLPLVVNVAGESRNRDGAVSAPPLQPGSAIAVQMVQGDYQVAAIGTVTLVDGNRFLAFGHQFTNQGAVDYLAYQANIYQTVKSSVMSFKMGAATQWVGRIVQDRQTGIAGRIGEYPALIDVKVTVNDVDLKRRGNYHFQVIHNEQALSGLVAAGVTDSIDKYLDRIGPGTAKVSLQINTDQAAVNLDNMFYDKDIATASCADLRDVLDLLVANEFVPLKIKTIQVRVDVTNQRQTARITKLEAAKTTAKPGEVIKLTARLRPFRGEPFTVPVEVKLSEKLQPGKLVLTARGEVKDTEEDSDKTAKRATFKPGNQEYASLADLVKDFQDTPRNNELILEYDPAAEGDTAAGAETGKSNPDGKPIQVRTETGYYLQGQSDVTIEIKN